MPITSSFLAHFSFHPVRTTFGAPIKYFVPLFACGDMYHFAMFIVFVGTLDDIFMLVVTTALVQAWWVDKGIPKGGIRDSRRGDRGRERGQEGGDNEGYRGFVHRGVAGGGGMGAALT